MVSELQMMDAVSYGMTAPREDREALARAVTANTCEYSQW